MDQATIDTIGKLLEQRIANKSLALPMLPQVTTQVLSLVNDINSDAAALANLIQSDQALAGHVMRIANSAAYSPAAKMTSLQQAIARLGMQNIAEIAMAATMGPKLFKAPGLEDMVKEIWESSLATAVWAREIARQGRRNVESTFLCGLLFQIGKPAVLQAVLDIAKGKGIATDASIIGTLLDRYQAQVGAALAEQWHLPVAVLHTIRCIDSNDAAVAPDPGAQETVATVRAALVFSAVTQGDRVYDAEAISTNQHVIDINLYADDVQKLLEKADSIHSTIGALSL